MSGPPNAPPAQGYGTPTAPGYPPAHTGWAPGGMGGHPRPMNMDMTSFLFRVIGFVLIFVGALVIVAFATPTGSLYGNNVTGSTVQNFVSGAANAILTGRILVTLGAFLLGAGAGMKLHWGLKSPGSGSKEEMRWVIAERFFNYAIVAGSIALLAWVVHWYAPPLH